MIVDQPRNQSITIQHSLVVRRRLELRINRLHLDDQLMALFFQSFPVAELSGV